MTLVVETGTGLANAESYASVVDATAYHLARGNSTWAGLTSGQMEEALRRATDYMLQAYRSRWAGYRTISTQALDWPRYNVPRKDGYFFAQYENNIVPDEVKRACYELALRAAAGELFADQKRLVSSVTVGPITTSYEPGSSPATKYAAIDAILAPLMATPGGNFSVVRA